MKNIELIFTSNKEETIADFMASKGFSSNNIFHEIYQQNVLINNAIVRDKKITTKPGDSIRILLNEEINELPLNKEKIDIIYEDKYLLIVNKPLGLLVEPYKLNTNNNVQPSTGEDKSTT